MAEKKSIQAEVQETRFLLVGPLPPPATGQSLSFDMLQREMRRRGGTCRVVDLSRGGWYAGGDSGLRRALQMIRMIGRFMTGMLAGYRSVYLTIAQSRLGFIRDAIMIWLVVAMRGRIVVHLKGGNYNGFYLAQSKWFRAVIRVTLRRVDQILVLGEGLVDMYAFEPRLEDRIVVVPNGLPEDFEGMSKSHPEEKGIRILFLSNLIQTKGYMDLLEALRVLRERGVPFKAQFAGEFVESVDDEISLSPAEARKRFLARVEESGLIEDIDYLGSVSGAEKWELLAASHVMVLATQYINEGQPVSIIEGMAYGCPVIATRFRAIPDLVVEGETGYFVEYNDSGGIADSLQKLAEDCSLYETMSSNSVNRYKTNFTMKAHLGRILPIIEGNSARSEISTDNAQLK